MTNNRIIIGENVNSPLYVFDNSDIETITGQLATDLIADALSIDRLDPVCRQEFIIRRAIKTTENKLILTTDGKIFCAHYTGDDLSAIPYGTPLWFYQGENLFAKFYVDKPQRQSRDVWKISAVSLVGLMDKQDHAGAVYTGQTVAEVVAEIFGGAISMEVNGLVYITGGIEPCYVASDLAAVKLYGWLPYATKRANLHQLLFATGASLSRDDNYNIVFKYLDALTASEIADGRIYMEGSANGLEGITGVEVTEHTFQWVHNQQPTELYNNTDVYAEPADNVLVKFSTPIRVSTATTTGDLNIVEIGQNFAVVSGKGTLSAIPYVHLTRIVSKKQENPTTPENIKTVTGATLVSPMNSEFVTARLFDYYTNAKIINGAIVSEGEKPGGRYTFKNAFHETVTATITAMSINATGILKGSYQAVTEYMLNHKGNNYNQSLFFTQETEWTVPTEIRNSDFPYVRAVLIGGGQGGQGGTGGLQGKGCYKDGNTYTGHGSGPGGKGGPGGIAGQGGKVYAIARLDVSNINKIVFIPGAGGTGGAKGPGGYNGTAEEYVTPGVGLEGGHSLMRLYDDDGNLVAEYSTADGAILPFGVADVTRDTVYGLSGTDGVNGADGGEGGVASPGADGLPGGDVLEWKGGQGSTAGYAAHLSGQGMMEAMAGGAGGGGAAYGANGQDAISGGSASWQQYVWGGNAGNGASAQNGSTSPEIYGQGGDGGHGGGGGGTGGAQNWTPITSGVKDGTPGAGGDGTDGANGAGGCLFLYTA